MIELKRNIRKAGEREEMLIKSRGELNIPKKFLLSEAKKVKDSCYFNVENNNLASKNDLKSIKLSETNSESRNLNFL